VLAVTHVPVGGLVVVEVAQQTSPGVVHELLLQATE
jgi:hypothetical protein